MDTESITEFILKLHKSGFLELKIDKKKLNELVDIHFTAREVYQICHK